MALRIRDRLFGNVTSMFRFEHPRQCPQGHKQISWVLNENNVHCWLCDKAYPMSECFGANGESSSNQQVTEEQVNVNLAKHKRMPQEA